MIFKKFDLIDNNFLMMHVFGNDLLTKVKNSLYWGSIISGTCFEGYGFFYCLNDFIIRLLLYPLVIS